MRPVAARLAFLLPVAVALVATGEPALAGGRSGAGKPVPVSAVSDGSHSFLGLGPDFSVPVEMERIPDAKLLLYNDVCARELGLKLPDDPRQLEEAILGAFAHRVRTKESKAPLSKTLFATYYLDSAKKGAGQAMGDGRAAWFGERLIEQADGAVYPVEFVAKGVGVTPLAWLAHSRETHRDGLMYPAEGIHDFITSEAAYRMGLETNRTLVVIQIPDLKMDEALGRKVPAVITVRVGPQFRPAHLRFHADDPKKLRKISDYLVRRMLRLPQDAKIGRAQGRRYLEILASKMGEQAALYQLLHAVQRNPTSGNRTLVGGAIDTGTFRFLDAFHPGYSIMLGRNRLDQQTGFFVEDYKRIFGYLKTAGLVPGGLVADDLLLRFDEAYDSTYSDGILSRLGLDPAEIGALTSRRRARVAAVFEEHFSATGRKKWGTEMERVDAAAFDSRDLLGRFWTAFETADEVERRARLVALLRRKTRSWQGTTKKVAEASADRILAEVVPILRAFRIKTPRQEWISRAADLSLKRRPEVQDFDRVLEQPIMDAVGSGAGWVELSRMAEDSVDAIVDDGLLPPKESAFGSREWLERNRILTLTSGSRTSRRTIEKLTACPKLLERTN
jgi:uncharacterized protein YdiU (UPF0061 family)